MPEARPEGFHIGAFQIFERLHNLKRIPARGRVNLQLFNRNLLLQTLRLLGGFGNILPETTSDKHIHGLLEREVNPVAPEPKLLPVYDACKQEDDGKQKKNRYQQHAGWVKEKEDE